MKIILPFEILDDWRQATIQQDKITDTVHVDLENKVIAINAGKRLKDYIYATGITENELWKSYKNLRKAVRRAIELGQVMGECVLPLDLIARGLPYEN